MNTFHVPLLTQTFVAAIFVLIVYFHAKYRPSSIEHGPTVLTTTGIFATFFGIAVGLLDFDPTNIQASLPALLGGLKTAFWGSVFGVGGALTLKIRQLVQPQPTGTEGSGTAGEVTAEDLAKLLRGIQMALVGNDESTLVSQLKLSRQDVNDRLDALKKAQIEALEKLSELGSKHLIEALKDVIRDFNQKLTEQFGDNFKQLNEAVGQLVVWQQQYKEHIETITARSEQTIGLLGTAADRFSVVMEKAGVFTKVASDLSYLLTQLEAQKTQLNIALGKLAELLTTASGSLPQIETKILELANQLSSGVAKSQKEVNQALTENTQLVRTSLQTLNADLKTLSTDISKELVGHVGRTKEQIATLDAALTEELTKSLESLGRQLTALSAKFVDDYLPLTERLREVVRLAGHVS